MCKAEWRAGGGVIGRRAPSRQQGVLRRKRPLEMSVNRLSVISETARTGMKKVERVETSRSKGVCPSVRSFNPKG